MEYQETNGTNYHAGTPAAVINALENARRTGTRVRLFLGDRETGEAWAEEYDVCGTVGRSMGPRKVPLMIANARSMGGGAILDHCILAIATGPGQFAYKAPNFNPGRWEVSACDLPGYEAETRHNGNLHGRHKTRAGAERFAAFMRGERMSK